MSLTIRKKLSIAIIAQGVFIALICFFPFFLNHSFNQAYQSKIKNTEEINNVKAFTLSIKDYFNKNVDYSSIQTAYKQLESSINNSALATEINNIWDLLQRIEKLRLNNKRIQETLLNLSDEAINQSSTFINKMSQHLADETERFNVSTLERLVISGANNNSNFYSKIKELFLKLTQDISLEGDKKIARSRDNKHENRYREAGEYTLCRSSTERVESGKENRRTDNGLCRQRKTNHRHQQ